MLRRHFLSTAALAAVAGAFPSDVRAQRHVQALFINPGRHDEAFWSDVSRAAAVAAEHLGIELGVVYGERNRITTLEVGRQAIGAAAPGSYVLIVNEQQTGAALVEAALQRGLKVLMVFNPLTGADAAAFGRPRVLYANFIGQLIPDNMDAGAKIARAVISAVRATRPGAKVSMLALGGLTATPAASDRERGLHDLIGKEAGVELLQVVPTDWTETDGYARCLGLLQRYPSVNAVWCANDPIAAGAMRALIEAGRVPGKDVAVAGLNWSAEGIRAVADGRMAATVGGHVLCAAFGLVLVADHAGGADFADLGVEMTLPFGVIDQGAARRWIARFGDAQPNWKAVNFRHLARSHDRSIKGYDFSSAALLG
ncbi:MAG TPA: ABC transporter substrate-binding protein [Magnetospirillum sp.]|nr:ABC transporter substrate-binding protein [Magnetospirillum sp.]